ncbi:MAG: phage holin family protein [Bacilli bacterium]|jgi:putative membrane protein|nr:phage holin family protein [Bacilli bacterium]
MKLIVNDKKEVRLNRFIDWIIYMLGYAIVLIIVSAFFKNTINVDSSYSGLWFLIASIIIYMLNKTIKPLLVWLTLPLTGLTMGLFYPFINVFILYITDFLLGNHFEINGIFMAFILAIFISIINIIMQKCVIEPLIRREK